MARPRSFDETAVIDRALAAFWQHGYEGCTLRTLLDATGLSRQSLYNAFGDKRGLFLRVLARYREQLDASLAPLRDEAASLAALRAWMRATLALQLELGPGACLMVITAFGPRLGDPEIRAAVESGSASVRAAIADLLTRAIGRGELPAGTAAQAHAAYLYGVLNGLSALARTGAAHAIETTLDLAIPHPPEPLG